MPLAGKREMIIIKKEGIRLVLLNLGSVAKVASRETGGG